MSSWHFWLFAVLLVGPVVASDVPFVFDARTSGVSNFTSNQLEQAHISSPDLVGVPTVIKPADNETLEFPVTDGGSTSEGTTEKKMTEENRTFWLNLDWNSTHPGGPLYKSPKQSIAYVRQNYLKTPVGLPPQYNPLVNAGMLACKVSDEEGNPLASTVLVAGTDRQFPVSVDLSGGFRQKLPMGDYTVTASKSGYKFDRKVVTVLEDLEASVDLKGTRENAPNIQIVTEAVDPRQTLCLLYQG